LLVRCADPNVASPAISSEPAVPAATSSTSRRFSPWKLFLVSFSILFLEMAAIRWLNASVGVLSYFNNLILVSTFFGLGVGCMLARARRSLIVWFAPAFLLMVVAVVLLQRYGIQISYTGDVIFAGNQDYYQTSLLEVSASALAGVLLNVCFFVILGQELGKQLENAGAPLIAYAYDIGGSLAGVVAYAALAGLQTPPHVWYGVALLVLLVFLQDRPRWLLGSAVLGIVAVLAMLSTYAGADWSPYYKVEARPYQRAEDRDFGYAILVDNLRIQDALKVGPELENTPLWGWLPYYELPYHFIRPNKVLVLGAGSGNEAAMAYLLGARNIHAVEIDPVIAGYGKTLHPYRPYASPNVQVIVDDARSYVSRTSERYDLILMSALDSHKQIAGGSSLRLESFVYTVESFARIRELLAPGGVFCLSLSSARPWMGPRVFWSLAEAFGRPPRVFTSVNSPFQSVSYVYGPDEVFQRDLLAGTRPIAERPGDSREGVTLATDDWPHLYLRDRSVPPLYRIVLGILVLVSTATVLGIEPAVRRPNLHFFFLGAGFMLLETRSVTQMALLFGSTWSVNAVVFASILVTILIANGLVLAGKAPRPRTCFAILLPFLALAYFLPLEGLLGLSVPARLGAAVSVVGFPVLWAAFVFSQSFRDQTELGRAFGSNLLGTVVGGGLEYLSNAWGLNALYLVALALYAGAAVFLPRRAQRPA
jgi:SAM-dependent methyltransferase